MYRLGSTRLISKPAHEYMNTQTNRQTDRVQSHDKQKTKQKQGEVWVRTHCAGDDCDDNEDDEDDDDDDKKQVNLERSKQRSKNNNISKCFVPLSNVISHQAR